MPSHMMVLTLASRSTTDATFIGAEKVAPIPSNTAGVAVAATLRAGGRAVPARSTAKPLSLAAANRVERGEADLAPGAAGCSRSHRLMPLRSDANRPPPQTA